MRKLKRMPEHGRQARVPASLLLRVLFAAHLLAAVPKEALTAPLFSNPSASQNGGSFQPLSTVLTSTYGVSVQATVQDSSVGVSTYAVVPTALSATANTLGLWHFENGSGTTLTDSAAAPHNGALIGGPAWVPGEVGNYALQFNGSNKVSITAGAPLVGALSNYTLEAWYKWDGTGGFLPIYDESISYSGGCYFFTNDGAELAVNNGLPEFCSLNTLSYQPPEYSCIKAAQTLDTNWHHLAAVLSGPANCIGNCSGTLYVDGQPVATASNMTYFYNASSYPTEVAVNVAFRNYNTGNPTNQGCQTGYASGTIDEVRVLNAPLTAAQVLADYNQGVSRLAPSAQYTSNGGATWVPISASSLAVVPANSPAQPATDPYSITANGINLTQYSASTTTNKVQFTVMNKAGASTTQTYTLTALTVTSFAISPLTVTTNGFQQFTAAATYSDSSTGTVSGAVFSSDNPAVATVTVSGLATAVSAGTAHIIASSGTFTSVATMTVVGPVLTYPAFSNPTVAAGAGSFVPISTVLASSTNISVQALVQDPLYGLSANPAPGSNLPVISGTLGLWHFDNGSGTTVTDAVGAHNGTATGASWASGIVGSAFNFTASQSVSVAGPPVIGGLAAYTIEAWVKWSGTAGTQVIYSEGRNYNGATWLDGLALQLVNGVPKFCSNNYSYVTCMTAASAMPNDGQWHHLAAVTQNLNQFGNNGGSDFLYLDGQQVASGTNMSNYIPNFCSGQCLDFIGARGGTPGGSSAARIDYFNGRVDELRILNYNASPAQIQADYQQALPGNPFSVVFSTNGGTTFVSVAASSVTYGPVNAGGGPYDQWRIIASSLTFPVSQPANTDQIRFTVTNTAAQSSSATYVVSVSSALGALPFTAISSSTLTANWNSLYPPGTTYTAQLSTGALPNTFSGNTSSTTRNAFAVFGGLNSGTAYFAQAATAPAGPFYPLGSATTLGPRISISQPANGVQLGTSTVAALVTYSGSYDTATFSAVFDNADATAAFAVFESSAAAQFPNIPNGPHSLSASITGAGVTASVTSYFTVLVDTTPPTIANFASLNATGTAVSEAQFNNLASGVTVQASVQDAEAGLSLNLSSFTVIYSTNAGLSFVAVPSAQLALTSQGAPSTGPYLLSAKGLNLTPSAAPGQNLVYITAVDLAIPVNNARTSSFTVLVDTIAPSLAISKPTGNSFLNYTSTMIVVNYSDAGGSGINAASLAIKLDGAPVSGVSVYASSATATVTMSQGVHTFNASIKDGAGNMIAASTVTATVDTTAPVLTIAQPTNQSLFNFTVSTSMIVTFSDAGGSGLNLGTLVLKMDGIPVSGVSVFSSSATATVAVNQTGHGFDASVADNAGNAASAPHVTVVNDNSPPSWSNTQVSADGVNWVDASTIVNVSSGAARISLQDLQSGVSTGPATFSARFSADGTATFAPVSQLFMLLAPGGTAPKGPYWLTAYGLNLNSANSNAIAFTAADQFGNVDSSTVPLSGPVFTNPLAGYAGVYYPVTNTLPGSSNVSAVVTVRDTAYGLDLPKSSAQYSTNGGLSWMSIPPANVSLVSVLPGGTSFSTYYFNISGMNLSPSGPANANQVQLFVTNNGTHTFSYTFSIPVDSSLTSFGTGQDKAPGQSSFQPASANTLPAITDVSAQITAQNAALGLAASVPGQPLANISGTVSLWHFDDGNSPYLRDATGSNSGTLSSSPPLSAAGVAGTALHFGTTYQYVRTALPNALYNAYWFGGNNAYTIEAWAKYDGGGGNISPIYGETLNTGTSWRLYNSLYIDGGGYPVFATNELDEYFGTCGAGGQITRASAALSTGTWHHLAATLGPYPGYIGTLYVDGQRVAQNSQCPPGSGNATEAEIGLAPNCQWCGAPNAYSFPGSIDEVRLLNYALSADQVKADYLQGLNTGAYYTNDGGASWNPVLGSSFTMAASGLNTQPFTLSAEGMNLSFSKNSATNQMKFVSADTAGRSDASIFNLLTPGADAAGPALTGAQAAQAPGYIFQSNSTLLTNLADVSARISAQDSNTGTGSGISNSMPVIQLPAAIAGYWPLNEGTGTTVRDFSGHGNAGTLSNGPVWAAGINGNGNALKFTQQAQSVQIPTAPSLAPGSGLTVEFWYKPNEFIGTAPAINKAGEWGIASTPCGATAPPNQVCLYLANGARTTPPISLSAGQWQHLAFTYDGSTAAVYQNGSPAGAASYGSAAPINNNNSGITIGQYSSSDFMNGTIAQFRVVNQALSAAQIAQDAATGGPGTFAQYTTNGGYSWTQIPAANLSISSANPGGSSADPFYITATGLNLAPSQTPTDNQINFNVADSAGNIAFLNFNFTAPELLSSININPANPTILQSQTQQFTAQANYIDGSTKTLESSYWYDKAPMTYFSTPYNIDGAAGGAINGILYSFGGNAGGSYPSNYLLAYDSQTNSWTSKANGPDSQGRSGFAGWGVINGILYVAGGWRGSPALPDGNFWAYDPSNNQWSVKASLLPNNSGGGGPTNYGACGAGAVLNGQLYITFGCNGWSDGYKKFLQRYDPGTDTWTNLAPAPVSHANAAMGAIGGKLYVAGGNNDSGYINRLDMYDPGTGLWQTLAPMPTARGGASGLVMNGKLYVVGGSTGAATPLATVEIYDPVRDSWQTGDPIPSSGRSGAVADVINGRFYLAGGRDSAGLSNKLQAFKVGDGLTWSSGNTAVSTISVEGLATGIIPGTAQITAVAANHAANTTLTVSPPTCGYPGGGANAFSFTDALIPHQSVVRALYVNELRAAVDALRDNAGLSAYPWSGPQPIAPNSTLIRAAYFTELRAALDEVYGQCAQTPLPVYSDPVLTPNATTVKTSAVTELRTAVLNAK